MYRKIQMVSSAQVEPSDRNGNTKSASTVAASAPITFPETTRLDCWKAIAAYLGREVRTVQRWEKTEHLPIHRHIHGTGGSVYAFRHELDHWKKSRTVSNRAKLAQGRACPTPKEGDETPVPKTILDCVDRAGYRTLLVYLLVCPGGMATRRSSSDAIFRVWGRKEGK